MTEALRGEIMEEARRKATETVERARQEAERAVTQAKATAKATHEKMLAEAKARAAWVKQTTLASVESKVRREKLKGQEAVIGRVYSEALGRLGKLEPGRVEVVMTALIIEAVKQMEGESFLVQVKASEQGSLTEEFLGRVAGEAERACGKKIKLSAGKGMESTAISGGVVVTSGDGRQVVDNTFEGRLARSKETLRVKLAAGLFGEEGDSEMTEGAGPGRITRVNGPIVTVGGLEGVQMYEVVHVGEEHLVGEVIRLDGEKAVVQVYEDTAGLKPGGSVGRTGMPLSLTLGPGMIGNVYDGIQRPLKVLVELEGVFIGRGVHVPSLDAKKKWHFVPKVKAGDEVLGGAVLGTVQETAVVEHRVMVPPVISGKVEKIVGEGEYTVEEEMAVIKQADGQSASVKMSQVWAARQPRPVTERLYVNEPLITGQRVIDTFFPIGKGGTAGIPGGFGTGKTMTQQALAKWASADIIVYVGCGERGNEMVEVLSDFPKLTDPRTGRPLMERTVLVANTSNMPVAAREVSIYTGITIAEYYRDMGYHVAVMADSTSRWAEALRELAARLEEMPAEEGFPAYLPSRLASFYERAGVVETLSGEKGSVSVVGAVSPPGGDFSEPVTQHTRRFIRCYWALDTLLANARHYPSISWLRSYSEYIADVTPWWQEVDVDWARLRQAALDVLLREDHLQQIVKLVGPDVLPDNERLVLFAAEMIKNGFLQQNAFDEVDMYSSPAKQVGILRMMVGLYEKGLEAINKGAPLAELRELPCVQEVVRAKYTIANDDAEGLRALQRKMENEIEELRGRYSR